MLGGLEQLGGVGDVHGAHQRQPAAGAVAKRSHFTLGVDQGIPGIRTDRPGGAQAESTDAGHDVARADSGHHIVSAAATDQDFGQAETPAEVLPQVSQRLGRMAKGRELLPELGVDDGQDLRVPDPLTDVHQARSRSVSVFHLEVSRQAVVEIIVGEQDAGQLGVVFRFAPLEPEDLRSGVARSQAQPQLLDEQPFAPHFLNDPIRFSGRGRIVPKLGGAV